MKTVRTMSSSILQFQSMFLYIISFNSYKIPMNQGEYVVTLCSRLNRVPRGIHAYPQNVTLFGNTVFEDVIKVMIKMRSYLIIEWALNPI